MWIFIFRKTFVYFILYDSVKKFYVKEFNIKTTVEIYIDVWILERRSISLCGYSIYCCNIGHYQIRNDNTQ